jgi:hypothetical protein
MFGINYEGVNYHLALILPFDNPVPNTGRGRDRKLRFTRIAARGQSSCVIVDMEKIIRGALLVKCYGVQLENEFVVLDSVDADIWWRMKSIKLARSITFKLSRR